MNGKSLLLLIPITAIAALLAFQGDKVATALGFRKASPDVVEQSKTTNVFTQEVNIASLKSIDMLVDGQPTRLVKTNDTWTLPGNWPVVQSEVKRLIETVASLKSRYISINLPAGESELDKYGLGESQKPIKIKLDDKTLLTFGQPKNSNQTVTLDQPTYARINSINEVIRLSPEVYAKLNKPGEQFRKRQLITDTDRVKLTGGEPAVNPAGPPPAPTGRQSIVTDAIQSIAVTTKDGSYLLSRIAPTPKAKPDPDRPASEPVLTANRLADVWVLFDAEKKQIVDKVDPSKLRSILTTIPDLWAEAFINNKIAADMGLEKAEKSITITKTDGQKISLLLGSESRQVNKIDGPPPSPFNPRQPPPQVITEIYTYAKLDNNPQFFEIRTDKLNDLFSKIDDLRDAQLARFETADVLECVIAAAGQPPIKFVRKKGNPDAEKDEEKQDRWYVGEGADAKLAEVSRITELLDSLNKLEARNSVSQEPGIPKTAPISKEEKNVISVSEYKKLAELGILPTSTSITIKTQPRVATGDTELPVKTTKLIIGKQELEKKKLYVKVDGLPRVNLVDDSVLKLIDRPALAYRGRKLFDTAELKLDEVIVKKNDDVSFAIKQSPTWKLTAPLAGDADEQIANQIAGDLSKLEAVEYVNDKPTADDLKKYGMDKPRLSINLGFSGKNAKPTTIDIGNARDGKPESYARLAGSESIFAIPNSTLESIEKGAVGLIPLQLWTATSDKVASIEISRSELKNNESYKLIQEGARWKLSGPFDAQAGLIEVQTLVALTANVKAERCDSLTMDSQKHGLDKPALKLIVGIKESVASPTPAPPATIPGQPATTPPAAKEEIKTRILLIGNQVENSTSRYASIQGNSAVFVIPDTIVKDADKSALEFLEKQVANFDISRISKVELKNQKAENNITLSKKEKNWAAEGNDFTVDQLMIDQLLSSISNPKVMRFAGYGPNVKWKDYGIDDPQGQSVVVNLAGEKPETHTIKLGRIDTTGERFARIDDGQGLLVLDTRTSDALSQQKLDFADRTMLNFDATTLTGISRKTEAGEMALGQNSALAWELTKPEKIKADSQTVDELVEQISKLRSVKVAAYDSKDLKPFGLDKPEAELILNVGIEKPESKKLFVGSLVDKNKPAGDRYAIVEGRKEVAIIAGSLATKLLADSIKFRDKNIAKFVDADRIQITRGERKAVFAKIDGTWKMTQPVATEAEQADLDEVTNAFAKLRADELVEDNTKDKELEKYGLDKPEAAWQLFSGEKEVLAFNVGKKDSNTTRRYTQVGGSKLVFLLDDKLTSRALAEYRKRTVWTGVDAAQIDTVAISSGNNNFAIRKAGNDWADTSNPADLFDGKKVSELLDALAGLKAEQYIVDKDADLKLFGLQPPEKIIVVNQKGNIKTLHLGRFEGDTKRLYAKVVDGEKAEVFVISEGESAKLLRDKSAYRK